MTEESPNQPEVQAVETPDGEGGFTIPFGDFAGQTLPFNDPLFPFQANLTGFRYMNGSLTDSAHINVIPIWDEYTGAGVLVGSTEFIDFGNAEYAEAYLDPPVRPLEETDGYSYLGFAHGTLTGGVFGAGANNGIGIVGIAHGATIVGGVQRTSSFDVSPDLGTNNVDVVNVSSGGGTVGFFTPNVAESDQTLLEIASTGRDGLGTIWVNSAGNGGFNDFSLEAATNLNLMYYISAGWADGTGYTNGYSSFGPALLLTAPSGNAFDPTRTLSTDRPGNLGGVLISGANVNAADYGVTNPRQPVDYFRTFDTRFIDFEATGLNTGDYGLINGTSGTAPIVTGVAALVLEAVTNNIFGDTNLGWRDVQEIFALSSRHSGSAIGTARANLYETEHNPWLVNGADILNGGGLHWSSDYGFGLVDAHAAVRLAETWTLTRHSGNLVEQSHNFPASGETITFGTDLTFRLNTESAGSFDLDGVQLSVNITHDVWAELEAVLISPNGTEIIVLDTPGLDATNYQGGANTGQLEWDILARGFWGEESAGVWTLVIRDTVDNGNSGTIDGLSLTFLGDEASDDDTYYFTDDWALLNVANGGVPILDDAVGQNSINAAALSDAVQLRLAPGATSRIGGEVAFRTSADAVFSLGIGTDQNDTLVGAAFDETLYGMQGDDHIWAGAGDTGADSYYGGSGNDIIGVGAGNDLAVGEGGDDTLYGGMGDDTVVGGFWDGSNADPASGGANELWGGAGSDLILGAEGNDSIGTSAGADTAFGYGGDDIIYGGADVAADTLDGGTGNDTIYGGGGNDSLIGGSGNDLIYNGAGNDAVDGRDGNDTLWGGGGDDTLIGGMGSDTFTFTATNGSDTVTDFDGAEDTLFLEGSGFADLAALKAAATEDNAGVTISFGDTVIILSGLSLDDLTAGNVML